MLKSRSSPSPTEQIEFGNDPYSWVLHHHRYHKIICIIIIIIIVIIIIIKIIAAKLFTVWRKDLGRAVVLKKPFEMFFCGERISSWCWSWICLRHHLVHHWLSSYWHFLPSYILMLDIWKRSVFLIVMFSPTTHNGSHTTADQFTCWRPGWWSSWQSWWRWWSWSWSCLWRAPT